MVVNSNTKKAIYAVSIATPIGLAHSAPNQTAKVMATADLNMTAISAGAMARLSTVRFCFFPDVQPVFQS
jgi:hypothetical protein